MLDTYMEDTYTDDFKSNNDHLSFTINTAGIVIKLTSSCWHINIRRVYIYVSVPLIQDKHKSDTNGKHTCAFESIALRETLFHMTKPMYNNDLTTWVSVV